MHVGRAVRLRLPLPGGPASSGIGIERGRFRLDDRLIRTGQHRGQVHPQQCRRNESHGRQHRIPTAHIRRHVERRDLLLPCNRAQCALLRVRGKDKVPRGSRRSDRLFDPVPQHEVLRQRFRGATGLRDHVDQRAPRIESVHRRLDRDGVHILEHRERGPPGAPIGSPFIPCRRLEGAEQRLGAKRRAADAEHDDMIEAPAKARRPRIEPLHQLGLASQRRKSVVTIHTAAAHLRHHVREPLVERVAQCRVESVNAVESGAEHQRVSSSTNVILESPPGSPSYAGSISPVG